jgi:hypothetical protein
MNDPSRVEFSQDGGQTWETIRLPFNCLPFHQVQLLGTFEESGNQYRRVDAYRTGS